MKEEKLLGEKELIWSPIVANCRMNRKRKLIGVNSYKNDLGFDILKFIKETKEEDANFNWIDLCCGEGNALIEASKNLKTLSYNEQLFLEGLDLVDMFSNYEKNDQLELKEGSVINWMPTKKYDLITCVHGLHYIGDKLFLLEKVMRSLKENGLFIANIDLENIRDPKNQSLKKQLAKYLKEKEISYDARKKILSCKGQKILDFGYQYIGADEKAGKNYTGQEVINSIYEKMNDTSNI